MRIAVLLALLAGSVMMAGATVPSREHPYRKHWKHATFGKEAVARSVGGAAVGQLRGGRGGSSGAAGFGKRLGSGFAAHGVKTTVEHAVAAPLHEDLHYHRSTKRGFGPRMGHALASTVVTRNMRTGKKTPAAGRLTGHAAAGAVSQAWLPGAAGASTAGIGLGADAGANVAREFWPRRKRVKRRLG